MDSVGASLSLKNCRFNENTASESPLFFHHAKLLPLKIMDHPYRWSSIMIISHQDSLRWRAQTVVLRMACQLLQVFYLFWSSTYLREVQENDHDATGALYFDLTLNPENNTVDISITDTQFRNNVIESCSECTWGWCKPQCTGGALNIRNRNASASFQVSLSNLIFEDNSALNGGGIALRKIGTISDIAFFTPRSGSVDEPVEIKKCTFKNNSASKKGGGCSFC